MILTNFDLKWHFKCSNAQMGCATSIEVFSQPPGRNLIFLEFFRSSMQIKDRKNTISIMLSRKYCQNAINYATTIQ